MGEIKNIGKMNRSFLLTYRIDNEIGYGWFPSKEKLYDFIDDYENISDDFVIDQAIEILSYREIL